MSKSLFFALILLTACARPIPTGFVPNTGRIISESASEASLGVCDGDSRADARWTPSQQEVNRLEPVLLKLIVYRSAEDSLTYDDTANLDPSKYYRDYFGLTRGRQNYILVCGQYGSAPRYIHDGGPSRFIALFDITRRTFVSFEFGYRA